MFLMWLECPTIAAAARPGQFVMVGCGEGNQLRRPLSIHGVNGGKVGLLYAIVGKGTEWLSRVKRDQGVDILGPLGNCFTIKPEAKNLLLVAGGVGVAPLFFLAEAAMAKGLWPKYVYGARTADELLSQAMFPSGLKGVTGSDDGTAGRQGMVTSLLLLPDLLSDFVNWADQVFACGPVAMYKTMAEMPELKGKPVQVSLEMRMACGFGVCYGCTVRTKKGLKQVCKDGPVFELDDLVWDGGLW